METAQRWINFVIFHLLYLNGSPLVHALKMTLFTTVDSPTSWGQAIPSAGWQINSVPMTTQRYAFVCSVTSTVAVNNWLRLPYIPRGAANLVYLQVSFAVRSCAGYPTPSSARQCNQFVTLRYYESDADVAQTFSNGTVYPPWTYYSDVSNLVPDTLWVENVTYNVRDLTMPPVTKNGFVLAFLDTGSCTGVANVTVYYIACPSTTALLATYNQTACSSNLYDFVTVAGTCVPNASKVGNSSPTMLCMGDGTWQSSSASLADQSCRCNPGYQPDASNTTCSPCSPNYFKSSSMAYCTTCPAHSYANGFANDKCTCSTGFYRASSDNAMDPCTTVPSAPSDLVASSTSANQIQLMWKMPSSFGGRTDVYYTVTLLSAAASDTSYSSQYCGTGASVTIGVMTYIFNNLAPQTGYYFLVCACNNVSLLATTAYCTVVQAKTLPSNSTVTAVTFFGLTKTTPLNSAVSSGVLAGTTQASLQVATNTQVVLAITVGLSAFFCLVVLGLFSYMVRRKSTQVRCFEKKNIFNDHDSLQFNGACSASESPVLNNSPLASPGNATNGMFAFRTSSNPSPAFGTVIFTRPVACSNTASPRSPDSDVQAVQTDVNGNINEPPVVHATSPSNTASLGSPLNGSKNWPGDNSLPFTISGNTVSDECSTNNYTDLVLMAREIPVQNIVVESVIGCGEFGEVCKGRMALRLPNGAITDRFVAVKTLKACATDSSRTEFLSEASIMCMFDHENILRLEGVVTKSHPLMIISEFMENGSLDSFLRANDCKLGNYTLIQMLQGVASGMEYLASKSYVHRDLAARNILVNSRLICKIGDFGLSRQAEMLNDTSSYCCYMTRGGKIPVRWTAPEAILYRKFTTASDIWSFGIVMWEVIGYGNRPYWDWSNSDVLRLVDLGYRLPPPYNCPQVAYELMLGCWQKVRQVRPSFRTLYLTISSWLQNPEVLKRTSVYTPRRFNIPDEYEPSTITTAHMHGRVGDSALVNDAFPLPLTVREWLRLCGLVKYLTFFDQARIFDMTGVMGLTLGDLVRVGVRNAVDQKQLLNSVQSLQLFRKFFQPHEALTCSSNELSEDSSKSSPVMQSRVVRHELNRALMASPLSFSNDSSLVGGLEKSEERGGGDPCSTSTSTSLHLVTASQQQLVLPTRSNGIHLLESQPDSFV